MTTETYIVVIETSTEDAQKLLAAFNRGELDSLGVVAVNGIERVAKVDDVQDITEESNNDTARGNHHRVQEST